VVNAIEVDPSRSQVARQKGLHVISGSIEDQGTWEQLGCGYDVIIFADVLEHLRHPEKMLVECHSHLNVGGSVLVSLPNIAHFTARIRLALGRFEYNEEGGILDSTHLRFYTVTSAIRMFAGCGFSVEDVYYRYRFTTKESIDARLHWVGTRLAGIWPNLFAYQSQFRLRLIKVRE
jgi:SAM-dependent methyltransferase